MERSSNLLFTSNRDAITNHLGILWSPSLRMRWDSGLKGAMLGSLTIFNFGIRIIESSDVLVPEKESSKLPSHKISPGIGIAFLVE